MNQKLTVSIIMSREKSETRKPTRNEFLFSNYSCVKQAKKSFRNNIFKINSQIYVLNVIQVRRISALHSLLVM